MSLSPNRQGQHNRTVQSRMQGRGQKGSDEWLRLVGSGSAQGSGLAPSPRSSGLRVTGAKGGNLGDGDHILDRPPPVSLLCCRQKTTRSRYFLDDIAAGSFAFQESRNTTDGGRGHEHRGRISIGTVPASRPHSPWFMTPVEGSVNGLIGRIGTVHDRIASGWTIGAQGSFISRIASRSARADRASGVSRGARVRACGRGSGAGRAASRVDQACPDGGGGHSSTESLICAPRTVA